MKHSFITTRQKCTALSLPGAIRRGRTLCASDAKMTLLVQVSDIDMVFASKKNHGGDCDERRRFFPLGNNFNIRARSSPPSVVAHSPGRTGRSKRRAKPHPTPPHPSRPSAIVPYYLMAMSDFDRPFLVWHPSMPRPIPRPLLPTCPPTPPFISQLSSYDISHPSSNTLCPPSIFSRQVTRRSSCTEAPRPVPSTTTTRHPVVCARIQFVMPRMRSYGNSSEKAHAFVVDVCSYMVAVRLIFVRSFAREREEG